MAETGGLAEALEREHHEIDGGIETFLAAPGSEAGVEALTAAIAALRRHIYLEEELLFPPLRASGLFAAIMVMLREHGEIWTTLDAVEAGLTDPTGEAVRQACTGLLVRLQAHNAKEEPIIYPQADVALTPETAAGLKEYLESGRMPPGWVCATAR